MDIIKYICIIYILLFIALLILMWKICVTKRQMQFLWFLFALSLAYLTSVIDVPEGWGDISRHAEYIRMTRSSGKSFLRYVFQGGIVSFFRGKYAYLYVWNAACYLAAFISDNDYFISAFCLFVDYLIIGYIFIDWYSKGGKYVKIKIGAFLLCFSAFPYLHAASGIRSELCASLIGFGAYLYLQKRTSTISFVLLCLVAALIHPAAIITVPFIILAKMDIGSGGLLGVLALSALAPIVAKWMSTSNIGYFQIVGRMYFTYTSEDQYWGSRALLYGVVFILTVVLITYILRLKQFSSEELPYEHKVLYRFLGVYMVYICGNFGNYDMVTRPSYVLGVLSPVLYSLISDSEMWEIENAKYMGIIRFASVSAILAMCFAMNFAYLIRVVPYFL